MNEKIKQGGHGYMGNFKISLRNAELRPETIKLPYSAENQNIKVLCD